MHTTYGREMPVHCAMYVDASAKRRLSCLQLEQPRDAAQADRIAVRFGRPAPSQMQRLLCTCAPVYDYTGRQVARVGVFDARGRRAAVLARADRPPRWNWRGCISLRLGHLPAPSSGRQRPS